MSFCVYKGESLTFVTFAYPVPKWPISGLPFGDKNEMLPGIVSASVRKNFLSGFGSG